LARIEGGFVEKKPNISEHPSHKLQRFYNNLTVKNNKFKTSRVKERERPTIVVEVPYFSNAIDIPGLKNKK
jgi:hypothetical protein